MRVTIGEGPVDLSAILDAVADGAHGAAVLFVGSVRRAPEDGPVAAIEYTAYEAMVREEGQRILDEAVERWPGLIVRLHHRVGVVPRGQPSIAVAASTGHRPDAFDAARWVVDEAKRRLPVWKREQFDDGSARWRENADGAPPLDTV